jgi:DNA-binding LacI/PurR family transcriptional regulator
MMKKTTSKRELNDRRRTDGGSDRLQPATLIHVARHAGVSRSTVSNVANGLSDVVGPETFQRVLESIRLFNYRPNPAARLLRSGRTRAPMLGLFVPSIANPFFGSLARALDESARKNGYNLLLRNTYSNPTTEQALLEEFIADGFRSAVLASTTADESYLQSCIDRGLGVVSCDRLDSPALDRLIDTVSIDNYHATYAATEHLIAKGHTAIAYVSEPITTRGTICLTRRDRRDGYRAAMKEAGQESFAVVLELPATSQSANPALRTPTRQIAQKLVGRRNRPTGIVAMNDMVAFTLIAGLHEIGVRVPDEVSVVGIDGLSLDALAAPPLTSMRQPLGAVAEAILERVQSRLVNPSLPATRTIFKTELVTRASVKDRAMADTAGTSSRKRFLSDC